MYNDKATCNMNYERQHQIFDVPVGTFTYPTLVQLVMSNFAHSNVCATGNVLCCTAAMPKSIKKGIFLHMRLLTRLRYFEVLPHM